MGLMHKIPATWPFLRKNIFNILLALFFGAVLIELSSLYMGVNTDDGQWEQFKADHHCRLLINESGNQRLSWQCDDGEIHYRWRQQR